MQARKLAPFSSLHLSRSALELEYPEHDKKLVDGNATHQYAFEEYKRLRGEMRLVSLEMAYYENVLKRAIGIHEGINIPGEGTLYWTKRKPKIRTKVNWMRLVQDLSIGEDVLEKYKDVSEHRRFCLRAKGQVHAGDFEGSLTSGTEITLDGSD